MKIQCGLPHKASAGPCGSSDLHLYHLSHLSLSETLKVS